MPGLAPNAKAADGGAGSTEELAAALAETNGRRDLGGWLQLHHPDDRRLTALIAVTKAHFTTLVSDRREEAKKALEELLDQHRVPDLLDGFAALAKETDPEALRRYADDALADVDVVALARGAGALVAEHGDDDAWAVGPFVLTDIEISGDGARATLDGNAVQLTRTGDRWYLRVNLTH
jgi:hypothetical protein